MIYRPTGNGRAERAVGSVVKTLRMALADPRLRTDWVKVLPWCQFTMNSLPGIVGGYSPHRIVFGRDLVAPGELPRDVNCTYVDSFEGFAKELEAVREKVRRTLIQKHDKVREDYLRSHATRTYQPGDRVRVKVLPHDKNKLSPLWMGPVR